jgi:hypothetical protein
MLACALSRRALTAATDDVDFALSSTDPPGTILYPTGNVAFSALNSLKGEAKSAIAPNTTITLTIKTAEGKSGQVKFKK